MDEGGESVVTVETIAVVNDGLIFGGIELNSRGKFILFELLLPQLHVAGG